MATKKKAKKPEAPKKTAAKKKGAKPAAKKAAVKKAAAKKPAAKKAAAKKAPKKAAVKKAAAPKAAPKKVEKAAPVPTRALPMPPKKKILVVPKNASSKQYTQSELYECIRGCCGFPKRKDAQDFYADFSAMIQAALKSGYKLALPGLGKLQVRRTKARKGINPATREPIMIPPRKKIAFTANKALKEAVL